jgi:hypothetical protein
VSRLCSRYGIRTLAVGILVLGLVGGILLSADRRAEQKDVQAGVAAMHEADEIQALKVSLADEWRANAPQRAAEAQAQAKANAAAKSAAQVASRANNAARDALTASRSQTRTTPKVNVPKSCSAFSGNQGIGCALMLQAGFGLDQMSCLVNIWNKESGWKTTAANGSGAYGIPQARPASKMAAYGSDYLTNPATQIKWGLDYIKDRYTSPCGAWSFWGSHNWY